LPLRTPAEVGAKVPGAPEPLLVAVGWTGEAAAARVCPEWPEGAVVVVVGWTRAFGIVVSDVVTVTGGEVELVRGAERGAT